MNSLKLIEIPSRLRAPIAIIQIEPLNGVVAPPRFVPRISADETGRWRVGFKAEKLVTIGKNVKAMATLLTTALAMPLNHKVDRVALNGLLAWVKKLSETTFKIPVSCIPPTMNIKPAMKNTVSQSSLLKISAGSKLLKANARMAQPKATASGPTPKFSNDRKRNTNKIRIRID